MARKSVDVLPAKHRAGPLVHNVLEKQERYQPSWAALGFDTSLKAIAGAGVSYDGLLDAYRGPSTFMLRWPAEVDYFERLGEAAHASDFTHALMSELGIVNNIEHIVIGVEEAWPPRPHQNSAWHRQQAEIVGAFMGGLARYGYRNVHFVNNSRWKSYIAADVGMRQNKDFTKWIIRDWVLGYYGLEWPDLVKAKGATIPRPESGAGAKAQPFQPDDRVDAVGIMEFIKREIELGRIQLDAIAPHVYSVEDK